ncbi:MAG: T9SS type A sorting domain-containing protein [Ferruginibacter sp.]|nr:T9SS type A sorting domain-containing protein [Ferruginibacter sp.]
MKKIFTSLICTVLILVSFSAFSVPKLNSYPSATATIFLDFDGHYVQSTMWNGGNPINCAASGMTDPQIIEAFNRIAEDFRPFDLNITTDSVVYLAAPSETRVRIIITTTSSWYPAGFSGVATSSFTWGDETPGFVFSDRLGTANTKRIAETISHESGHTVSLSHQSKYGGACNLMEQYSTGYGTGETGWAPIMGNSQNKNFSNWNNGPTPDGCVFVEDNLYTIVTYNGFGYRADDYGETLNAGTYTLPGSSFNTSGVITTNADKDAFKFTMNSNSNFHLVISPFSVASGSAGSNLDVAVELYNSSATLIRTYDPQASLSITIDTILTAGTYYIRVYGAGNANVGAYGSLGSYTITGSFSGLPIREVRLNGISENGKHNLSWNIVADEPVKTIEIQASNDAASFTKLADVGAASTKFSYQPYKNNTIFYRLKVTSVINQTAYSNTIALKAEGSDQKLFRVSTLVTNEITINADLNYQYRITDMNGSVISTGNGLKGMNRVPVSNLSRGMYIIQLYNNVQQQTERIIRQ